MMRPLSTTAAVVVTIALALLLVAYVFVGGSRRDRDDAPHCTSRQGLDQVKHELFRRAAALRGTNDAAFGSVADYSVVRTASRMFRRHHRGSDKVTCTGTIALDLPPGVAVVGGRQSLPSKVAYELEPGDSGTPRLLMLTRADAIVVPLASVGQASRTSQPIAATPGTDEPEATALAATEPPPAPSPQPRPAAPVGAEPSKSQPARRPAAAPAPAPARKPPAQPQRTAATSPAPTTKPAPTASAKPSFNCRNARTRGEIAVCGNAGLASLDRQMAAQFYSALSVARPGQREMLQRTRKRFLSYRDSCATQSCIAEAYQGRMREISDIMAGRW